MLAYLPYSYPPSDYEHIRLDGLWVQEWQGGYHDILERGYPQPKQKTTILAELYSPVIPDFLHGGAADVPFLISPRTKTILRQSVLTGFRFSKVEVVKIATKGTRRHRPRGGEPEDQIMKRTNVMADVTCPTLHAVRVIGRLEIIPKYRSGRCPRSGYVTPYALPRSGRMPDLWRPTINGRTFSGWVYCSPRFRDVVKKHGLSNIAFEPFDKHMARFRKDIRVREAQIRSADATTG